MSAFYTPELGTTPACDRPPLLIISLGTGRADCPADSTTHSIGFSSTYVLFESISISPVTWVGRVCKFARVLVSRTTPLLFLAIGLPSNKASETLTLQQY